MGDELPILKGILNGVVNYHNARRCLISNDNDSDGSERSMAIERLAYFLIEDSRNVRSSSACTRVSARAALSSLPRESRALSPLTFFHLWRETISGVRVLTL